MSSAVPILVRGTAGALAAQRRRKLTISAASAFCHRAQQRVCAEWETGDRSEVTRVRHWRKSKMQEYWIQAKKCKGTGMRARVRLVARARVRLSSSDGGGGAARGSGAMDYHPLGLRSTCRREVVLK